MNQQPEIALTGLKIFITLGIILACLLAVSYVLKKHVLKGKYNRHGKLINIIENKYIGVKKSILAVQIPNAILIVGLSGDNMCLLDKIIGTKTLVDDNGSIETERSFADYIQDAADKGSDSNT